MSAEGGGRAPQVSPAGGSRRARRWLLCAVALLILLPTERVNTDPAAGHLDPAVEAFLARPFAVFSTHRVPKTFRVIVLSNLAQYCQNLWRHGHLSRRHADHHLGALIGVAMNRRISPYRGQDLAQARLDDHGLYLSHLNLMLGVYRSVTGKDRFAALNKRISLHLARRSLADPHRHMPSYVANHLRWPADQAVTLHSLALYDGNFKQQLSRRPVAAWLHFLDSKGISKRWRLPLSEVTGGAGKGRHPRGCALSWTVRYMHLFAPARAARLWGRYKELFMVRKGIFAGFREWPPGIRRRADADSGPIVHGIGGAATGLALGASRVLGDSTTYTMLRASEVAVRAAGDKRLRRAGASILARSISLQAHSY